MVIDQYYNAIMKNIDDEIVKIRKEDPEAALKIAMLKMDAFERASRITALFASISEVINEK